MRVQAAETHNFPPIAPPDLTDAAASVRNLATMASNTQVTKKRRRRKRAAVGRPNKRERTKAGTPKFPIHPTE